MTTLRGLTVRMEAGAAMDAVAMLELSDGSVAIVDDADLERVARYEWRLPSRAATRYPVGSYCARSDSCETVFLHRLIANAGPEDTVLHRNHDTLDNRRDNLVVIGRTSAQRGSALTPAERRDNVVAAD